MQKILSLEAKDWVRGMVTTPFLEGGGGIMSSAGGINPYVNPFRLGSVGLLQTGATPLDLTSNVVVDTPIASTNDVDGSGNYATFILGSSGHLYRQVITTPTASPTDLRSGTPITNPANGLVVFQVSGAEKALFYWQKTQIGKAVYSGGLIQSHPTGWTDNAYTGLQDTIHHPAHKFLDQVFYGNKDRIGRIRDNAGTEVHETNVLDLPTDEIVVCLNDDGQYLVTGSTRNTGSQALTLLGARIRFWDTTSSSWTREFEIKDATNILSIKREGTTLYAYASNGIWAFNFSSPPVRVHPLTSSESVALSTSVGSQAGMDTYGKGILWGDNSGRLHFYGKYMPDAPTIYFQPHSGITGTIRYVNSTANSNYVFVGTDAPKYYSIDLTAGGGTSRNMETRFFDLKGKWNIQKIVVTLGLALASGDALTISTATVQGGTLTAFGGDSAVSFATMGGVDVVSLYGSVVASQLVLKVGFETGNIKIKTIDVWGTRLKQ